MFAGFVAPEVSQNSLSSVVVDIAQILRRIARNGNDFGGPGHLLLTGRHAWWTNCCSSHQPVTSFFRVVLLRGGAVVPDSGFDFPSAARCRGHLVSDPVAPCRFALVSDPAGGVSAPVFPQIQAPFPVDVVCTSTGFRSACLRVRDVFRS